MSWGITTESVIDSFIRRRYGPRATGNIAHERYAGVLTSYYMPIAFRLKSTTPGDFNVYVGEYTRNGVFKSVTTTRHINKVKEAIAEFLPTEQAHIMQPKDFERLYEWKGITEEACQTIVRKSRER